MEPGAIHILVGPTAVGKTEVAHHLARQRGAAILSADSMLVYRGLDIGTAKPTPAERAGIPYGGLDLVDPGRPFSVADYLAAVRPWWDECRRAGRPLLVVGGTGLYIRCLLEGLREAPEADWARRRRWEEQARQGRLGELQAELRSRFPAAWSALRDPENPRRLIRALERAEAGSAVGSTWDDDPASRAEVVGLRWSPADLHRAMQERIGAMYAAGLLDEVRALRAAGVPPDSTAWQAIGYAEAAACLDGALTREAAIERTWIRTRQLAKRQMTWFRGQLRVRWVDRDPAESPAAVAARVAAAWAATGPVRLKGLEG